MMISPEDYYEEYLKGKNEEQILTAIQGLKQEMDELKNIIRRSDYGSEIMFMSKEITRCSYTRMYLDKAKQALVDVGGTYVPSKAEQEAELFDANIPFISKVFFNFGGYKISIIIADEGHDHSDRLVYPCEKKKFLDGIRELHIGEWRTDYMNTFILDGKQWELTIEFSNGHKPFKSEGSNAYPYNFVVLRKLFDAASK